MTRVQIGIAIGILGVAAIAIFDPLTFLRRERYRDEVRALFESLQPGRTKEQARHVIDSGKYPHLTFHRDDQMWLASAPYEFGARNWVLVIEFRGEHVSALRVRTADGLEQQHRPAEAPPDKLSRAGQSD